MYFLSLFVFNNKEESLYFLNDIETLNPGKKIFYFPEISKESYTNKDPNNYNLLQRTEVIEHLKGLGKKILWAPDKHLGSYIKKKTRADMLLWDAACIVHEEFKFRGIKDMKRMYPNAVVLAHPESPGKVLEIADVVGSTTQIIKAAAELPNSEMIVATDIGIFHKLRQVAPDKSFIIAPTAGHDATCRSCANCPWMSMNSLKTLAESLRDEANEIVVAKALAEKAMIPLKRMLDFAGANRLNTKGKA